MVERVVPQEEEGSLAEAGAGVGVEEVELELELELAQGVVVAGSQT